MRLIDADALKKKHRKDIIKNLIDKKRNIDLSKYAKEPCDAFDKYIDEMPTVDVFEQIWNEIEELQQDILKSSETSLDSTYNISIGISMALGIIRKYMKGRY